MSVRVICGSKIDCYKALGYIHELFESVVNINRFDEYIVSPRLNGYSALQTTLETEHGSIEIAFVTEEMERFNNWGVVTVLDSKSGKRASYSRKAIFTLNDRVWYVPPDATVLDVAYAIHPALGRSTTSALVNNKKMKLSEVIPNASTVLFRVGETNNRTIHHEKCVHLPKSKAYIIEARMQEEWERMSAKGRTIISKRLISDKRGIFALSNISHKELLPLLFENGCKSLTELYYKVGIHNIDPIVIEEFLNNRGFTKNNADRRGILVAGGVDHDKPGILANITHEIAKGGANIVYIENTQREGGGFQTILLVYGMSDRQTNNLEKKLKKDPCFSEVIFV